MRRSFILICVALLLSLFANAQNYEITVNITGNGTVSYNSEALENAQVVTVDENATPAFTITPATGSHVANVIVDIANEGGTNVTNQLDENGVYTFEAVTANHTIDVTFEADPVDTYTITLTVGEHGTVTYNGEVVTTSVTVEEDATPAFTITPETGYRVASVIVDAETENELNVTAQLDENGVYTFAAVTADHTLYVTFEEIPAPTYTITLTVGEHGTVSYNGEVVTTTVTVDENATPAFTITPETDYRVASVILDAETENELDVTAQLDENGVYTFAAVTADHTLAVSFEPVQVVTNYTITATAGENGTITPAGEVAVPEGGDKTFTIAANSGYKVASVIVDAETENEVNVTEQLDENGGYTFTNVTADHTIAATFEVDPDAPVADKFGITFVGMHDTDSIVIPVNVDSLYVHESAVIDSVENGSDFVFGFRLAECHQIESVMVNDVELVADGEGYYTLANVVSDTTITISYVEIKYTLSLSAGEHGSVAVSEAEVDCGTTYTVAFVPESGYRLGSVSLDGEPVTEGISGNNYTLTVYADHTIHGEFVEFRGPYVEYVNFTSDHEVGDTIDFSLKMHSNCMLENLCGVGYELIYWNTDTTSIVVADATRYGVFSYNVNVTDEDFVTSTIESGSGMLNYVLEQEDATYNVGAFTLGLFDELAGRDRTIDYTMMFTTAGHYQYKTTLYTCANGGDALGSDYVAPGCDDLTHYDRVAETCSNPRSVYELVGDINVSGATIHTITTVVLGGHGAVEPNGTIVVEAGTEQHVVFVPDENYALDTVMVNGIMRYPTISQVEYVVDNVYTIDSITENYYITVKYKDVRPYYNVHVEVTTAGGSVTPNDTSVVVGSDVTLRVTPNAGYHISQLDIDGNLVANYASNEIIFRDIHEDHNVTISFFPNSVEDEVFAGLSIYPNPNNGQFTVSSEDFDGDVTFQIYSVSGSLLNEKITTGEQTVSFDNELPAGTYFLRIISGDKVAARKIVVE